MRGIKPIHSWSGAVHTRMALGHRRGMLALFTAGPIHSWSGALHTWMAANSSLASCSLRRRVPRLSPYGDTTKRNVSKTSKKRSLVLVEGETVRLQENSFIHGQAGATAYTTTRNSRASTETGLGLVVFTRGRYR